MALVDPEAGFQGGESGVSEGVVSDPWGVKRAENLISSLQGVLSARVVVSPLGEVTEIHVLAEPGIAPKQVVRNVESALLAQLGLRVDHRRISVAQAAAERAAGVLERSVVREASLRRAVLFRRVGVREGRVGRVVVSVVLDVGGEEVVGEVEVADVRRSRVQGAARAAVVALERVLPEGVLELEGCKLVRAFDLEFAFAVVQVVEGRGGGRLLAGTCEVRESVEEAAALAVLDATNRWVQSRA